ncbi:MAG: hypothetical protein DRJ15_12800 [Bacteroidetes bacterium]|nr:MAG: hypothetical protein DRJ15_12800 [Bacteroidota bacterium]
MTKAYFNETQRFRQIWIFLIILITIGGWGYAVFTSITAEQETEKARSDLTMILLSIIPLALIFLLLKLKLATRVRNDGIYFRFSPFHRKEKHIRPDEINTFEVRKYKPISEYGGWGIRVRGGKRGIAYNVSGNMGLQLYLKNGKKTLIGTQKPVELQKAMEEMMGKEG